MTVPARRLASHYKDAPMPQILILGGTSDAVRLAQMTTELDGIDVTYSLAGVTRAPNLPNCKVRTGGFGGQQGLIDYLQEQHFDVVFDATHPFATQISVHVAAACRALNMPCHHYRRTAWEATGNDNWIRVPNINLAASQVDKLSAKTFLTIGIKDLVAFSDLGQIWFLVRTIERPERSLPLTHYEMTFGRGPFNLHSEIALMQKHKIGAVVSRNSGGVPRPTKLDAAHNLDIPVVLVDQPPPVGQVVETIDAAVAILRKGG